MRKEDKQKLAPDMHRPIDKQEIQEPNEGDPEARERGHLVGQTAEAQPGVFETGAPSAIEGTGTSLSSSVDEIDPIGTRFRNASDDPEYTTTRDHFDPPARNFSPEFVNKRSDDDITVVATPNKELGTEGAELKHSKQKHKEPKEPMDR